MKIALLMLIPLMSMGQYNCSPYYKPKAVCGGDQVVFNVYGGACFHYNSFGYGMNYKGLTLDAVVMSRTERMPNMDGEIYGLVGYERGLAVGGGISNKGWLAYGGYNQQIYKRLFTYLYLYQTSYNMSHITLGIKIKI